MLNQLLTQSQHLSVNVKGIVWVILSSFLFAVLAALAKRLGTVWSFESGVVIEALPASEIACLRACFTLSLVFGLVLWRGVKTVIPENVCLASLRGGLGALGMWLNFYAFISLNLADAVAISFTRPILMAILAVWFLKELITGRRALAIALGFSGVLIIIRPDADIEPGIWVALGAASSIAMSLILLKKVSLTDSIVSVMFFSGLAGVLITIIPTWLNWVPPHAIQWALLLAMGLVGVLAQYCLVKGYRLGDATVLGPVDYSRLIFATILGVWWFGELPDIWTLVGSLVIMLSTWVLLGEKQIRGEKNHV